MRAGKSHLINGLFTGVTKRYEAAKAAGFATAKGQDELQNAHRIYSSTIAILAANPELADLIDSQGAFTCAVARAAFSVKN